MKPQCVTIQIEAMKQYFVLDATYYDVQGGCNVYVCLGEVRE